MIPPKFNILDNLSICAYGFIHKIIVYCTYVQYEDTKHDHCIFAMTERESCNLITYHRVPYGPLKDGSMLNYPT